MRGALSSLKGVKVSFGVEVVKTTVVSSSLCQVTVAAMPDHDGVLPAPRVYRARFCIATDGGSSPTRRQLGLSFAGETFPDQPWLVVDTLVKDTASLRESWLNREGVGFITNPACPFVFVPTPAFFTDWWATASATAANATSEAEQLRLRDAAMDRMWAPYREGAGKGDVPQWPPGTGFRFEMLLEAGVPAETATSEAHVEALMKSCAGVDTRHLEVVRKLVYTFHARRAEQWRVGPVLLAGDAAHCMPPFQGQGMNNGIRDVANLAWKVALVLRGVADDSLLDSYEPERRNNLEQVTKESVQLGQLVMVRSRLVGMLRDLIMSSVIFLNTWFPSLDSSHVFAKMPDIVSPSAWLTAGEAEARGQLLPCPTLLHSEAPRTVGAGAVARRLFLDELLSANGFTLVLCGGASLNALEVTVAASAASLRLLGVLGAAVVAVAPLGSPAGIADKWQPVVSGFHNSSSRAVDEAGHWTAWARHRRLEGRLLVVRPDRYIYGVFDDVDSAAVDLEAALRRVPPGAARSGMAAPLGTTEL